MLHIQPIIVKRYVLKVGEAATHRGDGDAFSSKVRCKVPQGEGAGIVEGCRLEGRPAGLGSTGCGCCAQYHQDQRGWGKGHCHEPDFIII